jgi:4-hydroxybenzoate polyprenyltransferase
MDAIPARALTMHSSRWHPYLRLARVSNLPTVWTNVLAGLVVARADFRWLDYLLLTCGVSLLYTAGMFLNDVFDSEWDAARRPDRPIPAGDVTRARALAVGAILMGGGVLTIGILRPGGSALAWAAALAAAIVYYDYRHKRDAFGPAVMGLCRGLVYCVAAATLGTVGIPVIVAGLTLMAYVVALTFVAKYVRTGPAWLIPVLIAGISIVDAFFIAFTGSLGLAGVAACGFILTLLLQRVVSGT